MAESSQERAGGQALGWWVQFFLFYVSRLDLCVVEAYVLKFPLVVALAAHCRSHSHYYQRFTSIQRVMVRTLIPKPRSHLGAYTMSVSLDSNPHNMVCNRHALTILFFHLQ